MNLMKLSAAVGKVEPFTTEQNDAVYQRLVSGDPLARDEMIEGNVALAVYRVDTYLRGSPQMNYYRDDMIGAALLGLCQAVDRMKNRGLIRNPKPTGYITRVINQHISEIVDESNTIIVSHQDQYEARVISKPIQPPRIVSEKGAVNVPDLTDRNEIAGLDLQEEIMFCCQDEIDRQIVVRRLDDKTDREIGTLLGITQQAVSYRRKTIETRLLERCSEYKETQRALAKKAARKMKKQ